MSLPETPSPEPTLDTLRAALADRPRPRVLLLASLDPLRSPGNAAERIAACGGAAAPWDDAPARALADDEIAAFAPEVIVTLADPGEMDAVQEAQEARSGWVHLPAAQAGDAYVADASLFAQFPRILATILHPDRFTDLLPPFSVRLALPRAVPTPAEAEDV